MIVLVDQSPITFLGLDYRVWSGIAVIVSLVLALFIPWFSEWWRRRPKKTDLRFDEAPVPSIIRAEIEKGKAGYYIGRLAIKNQSNNVAVSVEASVMSIIENGAPREGFLPRPLSWTYINNGTRRDIHGNQVVYVDVIVYTPEDADILYPTMPRRIRRFHLATPVLGSWEKRFGMLSSEKTTELVISVYQESGQVITTKAQIIWNDKDLAPELRIVP